VRWRRLSRRHDPKETVVVNVLDHVADFIGMGFKHDRAFGFTGECRPGGTIGITGDLRGMALDPICPDLLAAHFEAGGAGSL
jgi:hypothetical protein